MNPGKAVPTKSSSQDFLAVLEEESREFPRLVNLAFRSAR